MKLYLVELNGMQYSVLSGGCIYGQAYVVADSMDEAYQKVKTYLDENDIGYSGDRLLNSIKVVADENRFTTTHKLYL